MKSSAPLSRQIMRGQDGHGAGCCNVCSASDSSFVSVMIPAYIKNRAYALFFITFTLIGKCWWSG